MDVINKVRTAVTEFYEERPKTVLGLGIGVAAVTALVVYKKTRPPPPKEIRFIENALTLPENFTGLSDESRVKILDRVNELCAEILDKYTPDSETSNWFVYNGAAGVAYMFLRKYWHSGNPIDLEHARAYLERALDLAEASQGTLGITPDALPGSCIGFTGLYHVAALVAHARGDEVQRDEMVSRIGNLAANGHWAINDYIFGRAGAIQSIVEVNTILGRNAIPLDILRSLTKDSYDDAIPSTRLPGFSEYRLPITDGEEARTLFEVLMGTLVFQGWLARKTIVKAIAWLTSKFGAKATYTGASHGTAGVVYAQILSGTATDAMKADAYKSMQLLGDNRGGESGRNYISHLEQVVDPSCEDGMDVMHWCHGAPGIAPVLAHFSASCRRDGASEEAKSFEALARDAADLTWEFGLLKKGNGICHGVSGSGYTFLSLYRATRDRAYLARAVEYGLFSLQQHADQRTPDAPYSLFEGSAGHVCYLLDLLDAENSAFPFFEVRSHA